MKRIFAILFTITFLMGGYLPVGKVSRQETTLISSAQTGGWVASPVIADCTGPKDSNNRWWFAPDFDDTSWQPVQLADLNSIPVGNDRFYRTILKVIGTPQTTILRLSSDDGLWLYVNDAFIGHWGGNCHQSGLSGTVSIDITTQLHSGENTISAHVSNGIVVSGFSAIIPWQVSFPQEVQLIAKILSQPECPGEFGIDNPVHIIGDTKVEAHGGLTFTFNTYLPINTPVRFYYKPETPCQAGTYFSNDPSYARLIKTSSGNWEIDWSDYPDWNYNHLKIELSAKPAIQPFLELPFNPSSYGSFTQAVSDVERKGTVNAYFDHHYPDNYTDGKVVTFQGFDNNTDHPGFGLAYDGHDGIDFVVKGASVPVLAAADGLISLHPESSEVGTNYCSMTGKNVQQFLGNYIEILHPNGFTTIYGHLEKFADSVSDGSTVKQGDPIGIMGTTGCSTGKHIHFLLLNPVGIPVDPFGWLAKQFPDSTYGKSGEPDPWSDFNSKLNPPKFAIDSYLWDKQLITAQLNNPNGVTTAASPSGTALITLTQVAVPISAYRVEVLDGIDNGYGLLPFGTMVSFPGYFIYGPDDVPIWTLSQPATIRFDLTKFIPQSKLAVLNTSLIPLYSVYIWDSNAQAWKELVPELDPIAQTMTVETDLVGQLVVLENLGNVYLPLITK